jgi:hypothetical protein
MMLAHKVPIRLARSLATRAWQPLPDHLKVNFNTTFVGGEGCMIIGKPLYKYPIATWPPPEQVRPLFDAIRECEHRPFRIVSYEDDEGRVFNSSFFEDETRMRGWLSWLADNALSPGGKYHDCMIQSMAGGSIPQPSDLLFGRALKMIADTRFGEYQVGMAACFTRQVPGDLALHSEMADVAASSDFEQRIANCMADNGVAYFGRLAMLEDPDASDAGKPPSLITVLRYGSTDDAKRGTKAVRELMSDELSRWFGDEHRSMIGTSKKVMEL